MLVVGETGVGKSSLMLRYTDEKFMADILPTVGLDFRVKVMELAGYSVKVSIWDTAGQERFKNISSAYYRGAQGVVLVYDITERRTFQNLDGWLEELDRYGGAEMVKVVVGNKRDQVSWTRAGGVHSPVFRSTREELATMRGKTGQTREDFSSLRPRPGTGPTLSPCSSSWWRESCRSRTCGPGTLRREEVEEVTRFSGISTQGSPDGATSVVCVLSSSDFIP